MKRRILSVLILFTINLLAQAGEFWLSTAKFVLKPGENLVISFREGEDFLGTSWEFTKENISKLEVHHKNTVNDVQQKIVTGKTVTLRYLLHLKVLICCYCRPMKCIQKRVQMNLMLF